MPQDFQQNQRQSIEQVQRLQPMQMQGLEILTLPIQDLETRITAALEENPVLELDESPAVRDTLSDPSSYENDRELNSARMNEAGINEDFEDYQNENTSATWTDYLQDLGNRIDAETPENYDSD